VTFDLSITTRSSATAEIPEHDIGTGGSYTPLTFNAPNKRVPLGHLCKILHRGQRMAKVYNSEEILPNVSTP